MEQKINIAELLKDAPQGTELYSKLHGEVLLRRVLTDTSIAGVIHVSYHDYSLYFDSYGKPVDYPNAECMLLPARGQSWEDFKPSWKPDHKVFEPFQKVLVHIGLLDGRIIWRAHIYSHYDKLKELHITIDGDHFLDRDIESYEGNENLLGKEAEI